MNERFDFRRLAILTLTLLVIATMGAFAQDESASEDDYVEEFGLGKMFFEVESWVAKPSGLNYNPAAQLDSADPFGTDIVSFDPGTEGDIRYKFGYKLNKGLGTLSVTWFATKSFDQLAQSTPGEFGYIANLVDPAFAGYADDTLVDGFSATAKTVTRDLRIDYSRNAVDTDRLAIDWFMGVRRVQHNREQAANYFSLIPDLPPITAPLCSGTCPNLTPFADRGEVSSKYTGRGVNIGFDTDFKFANGRVIVEAGLGISALFGDADASATSQTSVYILNFQNEDIILEAPFVELTQFFNDGTGEFCDPNDTPPGNTSCDPLAQDTRQAFVRDGVRENNADTNAFVVDGYLGLRGKLWRTLEGFFGYRLSHYDNVGIDFTPGGSTGVSSQPRSATYDGIYGGVGYTF